MTNNYLELVRKNDRRAQNEFYEKYAGILFKISVRYTNDEQNVSEIVNIAFFKIFKNIKKFNYIDEQHLIAWMKKIVINECLIFLRKSNILKNEQSIDELNLKRNDLTESGLFLEDYLKMIKNLPVSIRTVFNMYAIDGYSHKEIAKYIKISESSSRTYLFRARKILQEIINKN